MLSTLKGGRTPGLRLRECTEPRLSVRPASRTCPNTAKNRRVQVSMRTLGLSLLLLAASCFWGQPTAKADEEDYYGYHPHPYWHQRHYEDWQERQAYWRHRHHHRHTVIQAGPVLIER